jgi:uncharacterized membrane protein
MNFKRCFVKAVCWETVSNLACFGVAYLWFGNLGACLEFTLVCVLLKIALFIPHEHFWQRKHP